MFSLNSPPLRTQKCCQRTVLGFKLQRAPDLRYLVVLLVNDPCCGSIDRSRRTTNGVFVTVQHSSSQHVIYCTRRQCAVHFLVEPQLPEATLGSRVHVSDATLRNPDTPEAESLALRLLVNIRRHEWTVCVVVMAPLIRLRGWLRVYIVCRLSVLSLRSLTGLTKRTIMYLYKSPHTLHTLTLSFIQSTVVQ